jgi:hypothetical protein
MGAQELNEKTETKPEWTWLKLMCWPTKGLKWTTGKVVPLFQVVPWNNLGAQFYKTIIIELTLCSLDMTLGYKSRVRQNYSNCLVIIGFCCLYWLPCFLNFLLSSCPHLSAFFPQALGNGIGYICASTLWIVGRTCHCFSGCHLSLMVLNTETLLSEVPGIGLVVVRAWFTSSLLHPNLSYTRDLRQLGNIPKTHSQQVAELLSSFLSSFKSCTLSNPRKEGLPSAGATSHPHRSP